MSILSGVLMITAALSLYLGIYAFARLDRTPARPLFLSVVAIVVWVAGYAMELSSTRLPSVLLWANIQFIGIGLAPVCWFETTRRILGKPRLPASVVAGLLIIPAIAVGLAFTDSYHDLFRGAPALYRTMGLVLLNPDYGWFHNAVFVPYQYLLYGLTVLLLTNSLYAAHPVFRRGYSLLIIGMILPMAGSVVYVLHIPPFAVFNPTPVLLIVTAVTYVVTFTRRKILDIRPIAREQVLDHLNEGVIVFDLENRLVDFNRGARNLFPELKPESIGEPFREILPRQIPNNVRTVRVTAAAGTYLARASSEALSNKRDNPSAFHPL